VPVLRGAHRRLQNSSRYFLRNAAIKVELPERLLDLRNVRWVIGPSSGISNAVSTCRTRERLPPWRAVAQADHHGARIDSKASTNSSSMTIKSPASSAATRRSDSSALSSRGISRNNLPGAFRPVPWRRVERGLQAHFVPQAFETTIRSIRSSETLSFAENPFPPNGPATVRLWHRLPLSRRM
jgi:hypothetical protein